jgi:7-cyano-7-deazaguanine reductase
MKYGEKEIKEAATKPLELWDNPSPENDYVIDLSFPEFTCLCPRSGYPDFASISVSYVPDNKVVELKAIKMWFNSFRNEHVSHEAIVNLIYDRLKEALAPRELKVTGDFNPRGNLKTIITVGKCRKA